MSAVRSESLGDSADSWVQVGEPAAEPTPLVNDQTSTSVAPSTVAPSPLSAATPVIFPPRASSSGKRYYILLGRHTRGEPVIACGQNVALRLLGGSWVGRGRAPNGYASWEEAVARLLVEHPTVGSVESVWT